MREIWETVSKAVGFPVEVKDGGVGRSSSESRTPPSLPVSGQFLSLEAQCFRVFQLAGVLVIRPQTPRWRSTVTSSMRWDAAHDHV
jgi:hypothetical protein